jgi:drug/metabolite transporter (DMT)-like permease
MVSGRGGLEGLWLRSTPALFVFLWSTGFVGAKLGLPHAPPATFLCLRFLLVIALMLPLALVLRAPWPAAPRQAVHLAVAGVLVHGGYLMGVFSAIDAGMSAGLAALIVGLQPLATGLAAAPVLGERVTVRQWIGLMLGIAGVALVVMQKTTVAGLTPFALVMASLALASITAGTLYQKRHCGAFDLRTGSVIQFTAALAVLAPVALWVETRPVRWTGEFVFALGWLVIVLSIAAISLLAVLIRRGEATKTVSLFYLTPPVTAVLAWLAFGERFTALAVLGMAVSVVGVAMVTRTR